MRPTDFGRKFSIVVILLLIVSNVAVVSSSLGKTSGEQELNETSDTDASVMAGDQAPLNKSFYLHTVDEARNIGSLTTLNTMNTTMGNDTEEISSSMKIISKWHIYPVFSGPVELSGNINLSLYMKADSTDTPGTWRITVREVNNDGEYVGTIADEDVTDKTLTTNYQRMNIKTNVLNGSYTVNESSSVEVFFKLKGNQATDYYAIWGDETYDSMTTFESRDYIDVPDVRSENWNGTQQSSYSQDSPDKNITIKADVTDPFGGYDIKRVNLSIQYPDKVTYDNYTMDLESGYFNSFRSLYNWTWDYSGKPSGQYNVTIKALDNNGYYYNTTNSGYGGHLAVNKSYFFTIGTGYYMNFKLFDTNESVLSDTYFRMVDGSNVVVENKTNSTGMKNISVGGGIYQMQVKWQDTWVDCIINGTLEITENVTYQDAVNITAAVHYKQIRTVDYHGVNVSNAAIYITHPNGTSNIIPYQTDENGTIELTQTASGVYSFNVIWRGVEVFNGDLAISNNTEKIINTEIYYMNIHAYDSDGVGLENTQIAIYDSQTGIVRDTGLTDQNGDLISRLPVGTYDVKVYWQGSIVGTNNSLELKDSDLAVDVESGVFRINIDLLDDWDNPVPDAKLSIISGDTGDVIDTGISNQDGQVSVRVPQGEHKIEAFWRNMPIFSENKTFSDTDLTLHVDVHYLDIVVLDSRDNPVEDARISIEDKQTGNLLDSNITDNQGSILIKLPTRDLNITVTWQGVEVNKTSHYLDNSTDLSINLSIYYVELRVLDSTEKHESITGDSPVENAQVVVTFLDTGRTIETNMTDENGKMLLRAPKGDVRIDIWWQQVKVGNETKTIDESVSETTLDIEVDIYLLKVKLVDSRDKPVKGAQTLFKYKSTGKIISSKATNENGVTQTRLPKGMISLKSTWKGITVNRTSYDLTDNKIDDPYALKASIYYLDLSVLDSEGLPVKDAEVSISLADTGEVVQSDVTNETGNLTFRLPEEDYEINITWYEIEVYNDSFYIDSDLDINASADVFYLDLHFVDDGGYPVSEAKLTIGTDYSDLFFLERTSDQTGDIKVKVPGTVIDLTATWEDIDVGNFTYDMDSIDDDVTETLTLNIGYVTFNVTDSKDIPIKNTHMMVKHKETGNIMATNSTDSQGNTTFRLPNGEMNVTGTWDSVMVYSKTHDLIGENETIDINAKVYYADFTLVDSRNATIPSASVSFINSDNGKLHRTLSSDGTGSLTARLPIGDYDIRSVWKDTVIYENSSLRLNESIDENLITEVYYWSFNVVDNKTVPVEGAHIIVENTDTENLMLDLYTDPEGNAEKRLPLGNYDFSVTWKDTTIYEDEDISVSKDMTTSITGDVYYLTVETVDKNDEAMSDVYVTIYDERDGAREASGITGNNGTLVFRLPHGSYTVEGVYKGNYLLTPVSYTVNESGDITSGDSEVTVKFSDHPKPVYTTNLFYLLVILAILVTVLVYTYKKVKKGPGSEEIDELEEEPEEESLDEEFGEEEFSEDEFGEDID